MSSITASASVLLSRGTDAREVFVIRRAETLRFFGGFHAFPGGKVSSSDRDCLPWFSTGNTDLSSEEQVRRVTACRELFEETGVLVVRRADGSFGEGKQAWCEARREILAGRLAFADFLNCEGMKIEAGDYQPLGHLVTPPFAAQRFDTAFYRADLPPKQIAEVWEGELVDGRWSLPETVIERWTRGEVLVSPPTVQILRALVGHSLHEAAERLRPVIASHADDGVPPILFAPHVQMLPLQTLALPPATHTNAFLIGREPMFLLDPGPDEANEQERLFKVLDAHRDAGRCLTAIILTHHHPDHIGAAAACTQRYRVPVWAHPWTADAVRGQVAVSRHLHDGEEIDLGEAPDGLGTWSLQAIHTPGHAPGHLAFYEPHYRLLFAADMISTVTSIIIAPPEGNLTVYLESLKRLQSFHARLLLPSHGAPSARPAVTLADAIAHRMKRQEELLAALTEGPWTIPELAVQLYRGLPPALVHFAKLQLLAGLEKLQREGLVKGAEKTQWSRIDCRQ